MEGISRRGYDLSGQCDNAASMFKFLAGGSQLGWKTQRLTKKEWPEAGGVSHYYLKHESGVIVDPTGEQFPDSLPVPYSKGRGATSGGERGMDPRGRRYPKGAARKGVQAVLRDPKGKAAAKLAIAWSEKRSGKKLPRVETKLPRGFEGFDEGMGVVEPTNIDVPFIQPLLGGSMDLVKLTLTPLGREELTMKLTTLNRSRRNPAVAKEVMKALKKGSDTLRVSRDAANFIKEELEHSLQILKDPSFASDPSFAYQKKGIEHSLRSINPVLGHVAGPASVLRGWVADARRRVAHGSLDLREVQSLVEATSVVLRAREEGCPEGGCIVMRDGKWRVIDKGTGGLWPQTFESKDGATEAIATYQHRRG
jgi:hypothetical protein